MNSVSTDDSISYQYCCGTLISYPCTFTDLSDCSLKWPVCLYKNSQRVRVMARVNKAGGSHHPSKPLLSGLRVIQVDDHQTIRSWLISDIGSGMERSWFQILLCIIPFTSWDYFAPTLWLCVSTKLYCQPVKLPEDGLALRPRPNPQFRSLREHSWWVGADINDIVDVANSMQWNLPSTATSKRLSAMSF